MHNTIDVPWKASPSRGCVSARRTWPRGSGRSPRRHTQTTGVDLRAVRWPAEGLEPPSPDSKERMPCVLTDPKVGLVSPMPGGTSLLPHDQANKAGGDTGLGEISCFHFGSVGLAMTKADWGCQATQGRCCSSDSWCLLPERGWTDLGDDRSEDMLRCKVPLCTDDSPLPVPRAQAQLLRVRRGRRALCNKTGYSARARVSIWRLHPRNHLFSHAHALALSPLWPSPGMLCRRSWAKLTM